MSNYNGINSSGTVCRFEVM